MQSILSIAQSKYDFYCLHHRSWHKHINGCSNLRGWVTISDSVSLCFVYHKPLWCSLHFVIFPLFQSGSTPNHGRALQSSADLRPQVDGGPWRRWWWQRWFFSGTYPPSLLNWQAEKRCLKSPWSTCSTGTLLSRTKPEDRESSVQVAGGTFLKYGK